jgi:activator of HSP90 ATPase
MAGIHQEVKFDATPDRVYKALTDSTEFAALTGAPAEISREVGGSFSCFGGMITGRQIELVPNRRVVQAWRVGNWHEGLYSITRFDIRPEGKGTKLIFDHTGYPDAEETHLASGWKAQYWDRLKKHLT